MKLRLIALVCALSIAHALRVPTPQFSDGVSRRAALAGAASAAGAALAATCAPAASAADELTYEITVPGDASSAVPQRGQRVVVDYTGWLNAFDGKEFDSTKGKLLPIPKPPSPFSFAVGVGEVIKGWDRSVRQMHVGETRRIVVPSALGYGDKGIGPIPGGATLYFEVSLLELKPMKPFSEKQQAWLDEHPEP